MNPCTVGVRWYSSSLGDLLLLIGIVAFGSIQPMQSAPADDPACKAVLDAMAKLNQTPHYEIHDYDR